MVYPSMSPWGSPLVLVAKKNGITKFCVERKLNLVTKMNVYPQRRIDDTLDSLAEADILLH